MPSWVKNRITLHGADQKEIDKVIDFLRSKDSEVDFNNIIPMPAELMNTEVGSKADTAWAVSYTHLVMRKVDASIYDGESVLIPRKGTLNNIIYVNGAFWTVDTMFYTKMKKAHSAIFVYYSAKLYDFEKLNTGTGVPSMTSTIIYNLKVVMPPEEILERFDNYVQAVSYTHLDVYKRQV